MQPGDYLLPWASAIPRKHVPKSGSAHKVRNLDAKPKIISQKSSKSALHVLSSTTSERALSHNALRNSSTARISIRNSPSVLHPAVRGDSTSASVVRLFDCSHECCESEHLGRLVYDRIHDGDDEDALVFTGDIASRPVSAYQPSSRSGSRLSKRLTSHSPTPRQRPKTASSVKSDAAFIESGSRLFDRRTGLEVRHMMGGNPGRPKSAFAFAPSTQSSVDVRRQKKRCKSAMSSVNVRRETTIEMLSESLLPIAVQTKRSNDTISMSGLRHCCAAMMNLPETDFCPFVSPVHYQRHTFQHQSQQQCRARSANSRRRTPNICEACGCRKRALPISPAGGATYSKPPRPRSAKYISGECRCPNDDDDLSVSDLEADVDIEDGMKECEEEAVEILPGGVYCDECVDINISVDVIQETLHTTDDDVLAKETNGRTVATYTFEDVEIVSQPEVFTLEGEKSFDYIHELVQRDYDVESVCSVEEISEDFSIEVSPLPLVPSPLPPVSPQPASPLPPTSPLPVPPVSPRDGGFMIIGSYKPPVPEEKARDETPPITEEPLFEYCVDEEEELNFSEEFFAVNMKAMQQDSSSIRFASVPYDVVPEYHSLKEITTSKIDENNDLNVLKRVKDASAKKRRFLSLMASRHEREKAQEEARNLARLKSSTLAADGIGGIPIPKFIDAGEPDYRLYEPKDLMTVDRERVAREETRNNFGRALAGRGNRPEQKPFTKISKTVINVQKFIKHAKVKSPEERFSPSKQKEKWQPLIDEARRDRDSASPHTPSSLPSSDDMQNYMEKLLKEEKDYAAKRSKLKGNLNQGNQTSRYDLPVDMQKLESMTPMLYLLNHCTVSRRREALYKSVFQKFDKRKPYGTINFKDMEEALMEVHDNLITQVELKQISEMLCLSIDELFDKKQFNVIAAFSERVVHQSKSDIERHKHDDEKHGADEVELVERADMSALQWKLHGIQLDSSLVRVLEMLSKS